MQQTTEPTKPPSKARRIARGAMTGFAFVCFPYVFIGIAIYKHCAEHKARTWEAAEVSAHTAKVNRSAQTAIVKAEAEALTMGKQIELLDARIEFERKRLELKELREQ